MTDWSYRFTDPRFDVSVVINKLDNVYSTHYKDYISSHNEENIQDFYKAICRSIKKLRKCEHSNFINSLLSLRSLSLEETLVLTKIKNELS